MGTAHTIVQMPSGTTASFSRELRADYRRCPACGQRLDPPAPERCPLCDYRFTTNTSTSDDGTPYAAAYADGRPGWWAMVRWVYAAREIRLKHLALMRVSAASKHFARASVLWASVGLACLEWTRLGWSWTGERAASSLTSSSLAPSSPRPLGNGWFHLVSSPAGNAETVPGRATELWWNAAQALIAAPLSMVLGLVTGLLLLVIIRTLVVWAHGPPFRSERRMGAALCYSLAWIVPLLAASAIVALRPLAYVGAVAHWFWYPPQPVIDGMAGVAAIGGLVLWWFWLFRMAMTAPAITRTRVVIATALAVPMLVAATGVGWYVGFPKLCGAIFRAFGLQA